MFRSSQECLGRVVTLFLRQHGGGRRCSVPGCFKGAQGRTDKVLRTTVLHFVELDTFVLIISVWATEEANVVRLQTACEVQSVKLVYVVHTENG
jgi:hypothetical protein